MVRGRVKNREWVASKGRTGVPNPEGGFHPRLVLAGKCADVLAVDEDSREMEESAEARNARSPVSGSIDVGERRARRVSQSRMERSRN